MIAEHLTRIIYNIYIHLFAPKKVLSRIRNFVESFKFEDTDSSPSHYVFWIQSQSSTGKYKNKTRYVSTRYLYISISCNSRKDIFGVVLAEFISNIENLRPVMEAFKKSMEFSMLYKTHPPHKHR